jgi:SAM-dependent methyltransferase
MTVIASPLFTLVNAPTAEIHESSARTLFCMSTEPSHSIYSTQYQWTLKGMALFELKSLIGRYLLNRAAPVLNSSARLLNLGSGERPYPEFVNADFFRIRPSSRKMNFWGLDFRYPLNCPDNHWDGVFTEHTLEHLHPERVLALLKEVHRTLKPGAWLRIVVPDLAKYVDYYTGVQSHEVFNQWPIKGAALRSISQNYLHLALWDYALIEDCLRRAGFDRIERRSLQAGADPRLIKDAPERAPESLYVEAQK